MHISKQEYNEFVKRGLLPPLEELPAKEKPKDQYKSKAERLMAWRLQDLLKDGVIEWWAYEPFTIVVADAKGDRARYTPDFLVIREDFGGKEWHFIEVKGYLREAARVRFISARERYPFCKFTMQRFSGGVWHHVMGDSFFADVAPPRL
jgi:hypothetical protein